MFEVIDGGYVELLGVASVYDFFFGVSIILLSVCLGKINGSQTLEALTQEVIG